MTNTKAAWKALVIIFILSSIFCAIYYHFHSDKNKTEIYSRLQVENVINNFFIEIKNGNLEDTSQYIDLNNKYYNLDFKLMNSTNQSMLKSIFTKIDYKIVHVSIRGSSAKARVQIVSIDLLNLYGKYSKELNPLVQAYLNGDKMERIQAKSNIKAILANKISKDIEEENYQKLTGIIKISLKKKDGKWIIEPDKDLIYYLTGKFTVLMSK
ncbi:hypothetical protein ACJDU8_16750 [Clostridium sp. WILCCON 0269]|uniref:Lipoprotein n=1 Tax=Candidatus Clostridium eludens TaxID=3381663 RepID=A0ABW8SNF7_9CLOT